MITAPARILLFAMVPLAVLGCMEFRDHLRGQPQAESTTKTSVANLKEWPYWAQFNLEFHGEKAYPRGISLEDMISVVKKSRFPGGGISTLAVGEVAVRGLNGDVVPLSEIATVDVYLLRRDSSASDLRSPSVHGTLPLGPEGAQCVAQVTVTVDEKKAAVNRVKAASINARIANLRSNEVYSLADIRDLTINSEGGDLVRIGDVATIEAIVEPTKPSAQVDFFPNKGK